MATAILLGVIQGVFEWLPVSSEGLVAAAYSALEARPLDEAVNYALWLHLGTVPSVVVVFWKDLVRAVREFLARPTRPSSFPSFLIVAVAVSAVIGFPILLALQELSDALGAAAMGVVGALLLVTGFVQLRRNESGTRDRTKLTTTDGLLAGVAQGVAVLPGLSRSGMTIAVLLGRRIDRREALVLSFLMSIPAGLGAGIYAAFDSEFTLSTEAFVATSVAFVVGLVTIKGLLAIAQRINFGLFVVLVGVTVLAGAAWQAL